MTTSEFLAFISYARADRTAAESLYDYLVSQGIEAWLDTRKIMGGQNWDFEIKKALDRSSVILVLLSKSSIDHRGYAQREIKLALDKYEEKLIDDIYIVPIILDNEVNVPQQFKSIHCLRYEDINFKTNVLESLNHQIERLGGERLSIQEKEDIYWSSKIIKEEWEGAPGYSAEIEILDFSSKKYTNISYVADLIKGNILELLFEQRNSKFEQDTKFYSYGKDKWARTNTVDAFCGDPHIFGNVMTVNYSVSHYSAGAAHPSHGFRSFSFVLNTMMYISNLSTIFLDESQSLIFLQKLIPEILVEESKLADGDGNSGIEFDIEWVKSGIENWENFSSFVFTKEYLLINFGSYQIAPYAAGTPSVEIPYKLIYKQIKNDYLEALNLPVWKFDNLSGL